MFLKSLELYGFKSFADKTKLQFSDGITSLLGPNGCGKSNIVDAIKWVLGEQSTKTLRAGRMEDVIFNGTDTRKPLQFAEVALVICNEENALPIEAAEIEIKRRIFRNGESEYYLNKNRVLLKNIRELFFDTGVGKSAYSILEQGKIDQILSSKPEDRRYIFEEAAGISRFKADSEAAQRKLIKTDENILQVDTILREVRKSYDTKKSQAAKASEYRQLKKEQVTLEVDVQLSTLKSYLLLRDSKEEQKRRSQTEYERQRGTVTTFDAEIEEMQAFMRDKASQRIAFQTELQRLDEAVKGRGEKLDLLTQRFRDFCRQKDEAASRAQGIAERIERETEEIDTKLTAIAQTEQALAELDAQIVKNQDDIARTRTLIESQETEIVGLEEENASLDHDVESLSGQIDTLTDGIVVELEEKLNASGYNLKEKQEARVAFETKLAGIESQRKEHAAFLDRLTGLEPASIMQREQRYLATLAESLGQLKTLFETYRLHDASFIDDLMAPKGIIAQKHDLDAVMAKKRKHLADNRERMAYLREENRKLAVNLETYRTAIEDQKIARGQLENRRQGDKEWVSKLQLSVTERQYQQQDALKASENAQDRIYETQEDIRQTKSEIEGMQDKIASLNEELKDIIVVIEEQGEAIGRKQSEKTATYEQLQNLRSEGEKLGFQVEQLSTNIADIYTTFFETYGKSLKEYEGRLDEELNDIPVLKNRLDVVRKRIASMGYINQMAEEEFAEVKEQYDFLSRQMDDLTKAKDDLQKVVLEIRTRSEELFLSSYRRISENFQEMFRRLFGGGRAELRLVDPENVLESGIDILSQPPGKKLTHLSLLSGGERSMTAVALLFATYMVKPSPFCVLDEIDAALDDRNIGYFLSVLQDFATKSQFIIITHNKHTVMGSTTLLGVTQMEAGVSTMVSYRMGNMEGEPVILDDEAKEVSIE